MHLPVAAATPARYRPGLCAFNQPFLPGTQLSLPSPSCFPLSPGVSRGEFGYGSPHKPSCFFRTQTFGILLPDGIPGRGAEYFFFEPHFGTGDPFRMLPELPGLHAGLRGNLTGRRVRVCLSVRGPSQRAVFPSAVGYYDPLRKTTKTRDVGMTKR